MRKRIIVVGVLWLLLFFNFSSFALAANLQDPFEAYGLEKGDEDIPFRMTDNPPDVFVLKPVEYRYGEIKKPLNMGQITLKKGGDSSFNISTSWEQGHTSWSVKSHVTIKYRQSEDPRVLFETEHQTEMKSVNSRRLQVGADGAIKTETHNTVSHFYITGAAEGNLKGIAVLGKESGAGNVGEIVCDVVGVQVKGGGLGIFEIDTDASTTDGETSMEVPAAIVIGLAGAAVAVAGVAAAGTSGAAAGANSGTQGEEGDSTYKMVIYKDFGDKIKYDAEPVFVYARIVETNAQGVDVERPDLTEQIEIFSDESFMEVGSAVMSGEYMGASVMASATHSHMPAEGIISFRFIGEGGAFQNNVKFKMIGEAYIALEEPNLFVLAGSSRSFQLPYELKDFLNEAEVTVKAFQDNRPFDLEIGKDKEGNPVIIATDRGEKKPTERFFESYSCEIIAENEKEYARTVFDVVMCYEGLLPDFLGKLPEIRCYKKEDGEDEMEETLIAFKLGLWNENDQNLYFIRPEGMKIDCTDENGIFQVIGIEYEEDTERIADDAIYYIFKAKISLPALEPIKGQLIAAVDYNGNLYESETDIELIPDILQYEADFEKEYQNCIYIINTYLPERFRDKKLEQLEQAKSNLGIEDLKLFRKTVWQIAQRAILQDKERYMQESYWWDEAIATAELVVAVGDIAFDVVLASVGGPLAGFAATQVKGAALDFWALYVEKPSIGMPELQEFLEKRFVQMVGQADGAFNMPEPTETKKLAAWLTSYTVYRIFYHWWYDKDNQNNPIGITEAVKRGIYDLAGKGASTLLSGYIKESSFETGKVADFAKGDQKLYDDAVQKATDTLTDFIDRIKNGGIQFT
ncbi:MAG: hypothetical protein PWQ67_2150 [Clostridia bacterium]|jgi:hypothetical protein|nr:hypothetical protein [Clostridia bacterium]